MENLLTFPNNILKHTLISEEDIINKMNSYSDTDSDSEENLIRMNKNKNKNEVWNEEEDNIILDEREKKKYGHTTRAFERLKDEANYSTEKSLEQVRMRSLLLKNKSTLKSSNFNKSIDKKNKNLNNSDKDSLIIDSLENSDKDKLSIKCIVDNKFENDKIKIRKRKIIDRFKDLEECKDFMTTEEYNDKRESLIGLI